jgi:hypothetical protein
MRVMNKWTLIFGYAGTLPFIACTLITLTINNAQIGHIATFTQLSYAAMILSFLGGVHWGQALQRDNAKHMAFAMLPSVASLFIILYALMGDTNLALAMMAALFWILYAGDRKLMPEDLVPKGYFTFRLTLTIIVSLSLFIPIVSTLL